MDNHKAKKIKKIVRESYAQIITKKSCCSTCGTTGDTTEMVKSISKKIGYTDENLQEVPKDSNLVLGCGNPIALASLKQGETVLDLGSGTGFDCFLAANRVGDNGKVIGVDMTQEMIDKARENTKKGDYKNVEFRHGEIENLPLSDNSVDVVISNCVINLSPDKGKVFMEAFRVLKHGGRLMVSDIVLLKELPDCIKNSVEAYIGCLAGAILKEEYINKMKVAGFQDIKILNETIFPIECMANDPTAKIIMEKIPYERITGLLDSVVSIDIYGIKNGGK